MPETTENYLRTYAFAYRGLLASDEFKPPRRGEIVFTKFSAFPFKVVSRRGPVITIEGNSGDTHRLFQGEYVTAAAMRHGIICMILDRSSVDFYSS